MCQEQLLLSEASILKQTYQLQLSIFMTYFLIILHLILSHHKMRVGTKTPGVRVSRLTQKFAFKLGSKESTALNRQL